MTGKRIFLAPAKTEPIDPNSLKVPSNLDVADALSVHNRRSRVLWRMAILVFVEYLSKRTRGINIRGCL